MIEMMGHVLESVGGIGLLLGEIQERRHRALEFQELANVKGRLNGLRTVLTGALETNRQVNERLYGNPEYTLPESITNTRAQIRQLEEQLETLQDPQRDHINALPTSIQFYGLLAIVAGFLFQLFAALAKG